MIRSTRLVLIFLAVLCAACGRSSAPSTAAPTQASPTPISPSAPSTPVPIAPKDNGYVSLRPTFVVGNASHQSGVALQYAFTIATDAAFANVVAKGAVPEGVDQTTFTPSFDLPAMTTIFWRAQAFNDSTNDLRSGFATGTFVTPFVGPAQLTISTTAPCNSFMTDFVFDGNATASAGGFVVQTEDFARRASSLTIDPAGGGSVSGHSWATGQGARCFSSDYAGMKIEVLYVSDASISSASFSTPGRITGTFTGTLQFWNAFGDGGSTQHRTYAFTVIPQ